MNDRRNHLLLLLAGSLIGPIGCSKADVHLSEPPTVSGLEVAQVQERQVPKTLTATGTVHAQESATLSAQMMGRVNSVLVREGDQIQAGRLLVVLDGAQALSDLERARASVASSEAGIKGAETDADLAKSTLVRYEVLRDKKSVSLQEFDEVQRRSQSCRSAAGSCTLHDACRQGLRGKRPCNRRVFPEAICSILRLRDRSPRRSRQYGNARHAFARSR